MTAKKKPARPAAKRKRPSRSAVALPTPTSASLITGDTRKRLDRFCEAHHGADPEVVVYKAINDFITGDLEDNKGTSDTFNLV